MSSNLEPPRSLVSTALIVVSAFWPAPSLVAIYFRFRARGVARAHIQADDWWIAASWLLALPLSINAWVFGSITGIDHYKIDLMKGITYSLQCIFISSLLVQPALTAVKIAILLFYKRIFGTAYYQFGIAVWIAIAVVTIWGFLFFFIVLFMGDPISAAWTGQGVFRYDVTAAGVAQVASSVALDFLVLCFPLPVISTLQIPAKKKFAVIFIFWLGIFCCVAAIARTVLLKRSIQEVADSRDTVYTQSTQFVFMILEPHCSIIAACLPCYGPLLRGKGLTPEWLARSIRSIVSLATRGLSSNGSRSNLAGAGIEGKASTNNSSSKISKKGFTHVGTDDEDEESQTGRSGFRSPAQQIHLGDLNRLPGDWPEPYQHTVAVTPGPAPTVFSTSMGGNTGRDSGRPIELDANMRDGTTYEMQPVGGRGAISVTRGVNVTSR